MFGRNKKVDEITKEPIYCRFCNSTETQTMTTFTTDEFYQHSCIQCGRIIHYKRDDKGKLIFPSS